MGADRFYVEAMTQQLTKYINNRLRNDDRIVDWAFYMEGKNKLVICMDYEWNLHSKTQMIVDAPYDFESLKMMFDSYFDKHLYELGQVMKGELK